MISVFFFFSHHLYNGSEQARVPSRACGVERYDMRISDFENNVLITRACEIKLVVFHVCSLLNGITVASEVINFKNVCRKFYPFFGQVSLALVYAVVRIDHSEFRHIACSHRKRGAAERVSLRTSAPRSKFEMKRIEQIFERPFVNRHTDDFFDYNGYGYGVDRDGVILMLCLAGGEGNRDVHISGRGSVGRNVFNSKYVLNFDNGPIFKELKPLLSAGRYYDAEMKFLEMADERLGWYADDIANGGTGKVPYPASVILKRELIAVAVAMVIAFFVVSMFKKTMKTNRIRTSAGNYEKPGSMRVTTSNEYFVRKQVSRTAIPKNESSDSSGDHTSSSGASHSGGGGKF